MSAANISSPGARSRSAFVTSSSPLAWSSFRSSSRPRERAGLNEHAPPNPLGREPRPHILPPQHNPVDWYPWGPEAFERARAEDKPLLLSVGYSACHWCHV